MSDKKTTPKHNSDSPCPHAAPLTGPEAVEPHYKNTIDPGMVKPTPLPTPPGQDPMAPGSLKSPRNSSDKIKQLDRYRADGEGRSLTTNMGVNIADNQNSLKAGERGPSLLEDFHHLEKMAHFGRERIPERVVHARGSGAYGYFQVYEPLAEYTKAAFLQDPKVKTPVFVRFSTVQGFRGSPDTVRDIRGWATKFYTSEGNFDLVGNDTAVFFIQDALKFPDFVHAVKPEPHNEVPQGQSAHDSFWDYVSLQPETLHNVMWAMSDRGIPRSYRMMEGFGIHTYKLLNARGVCHFVRFHWKPVYGTASLLWDESQALTGRDPDFHRKDLWQAIEAGDYPEYELGLQIIPEKDEKTFDFDILDPTKLIPEALVPVRLVGKMTLNRNPDNFFAETEQSAFCPANIVPGIDFSDDPLLQGRVFAYKDTQMHRLGGPNFAELPVNRPLVDVRNQQRDGFNRMQIDTTTANYEPNSVSANWPRETPEAPAGGGFHTHGSGVQGMKTRLRSPSFREYYAHPRLFWLSQTEPEKKHMVAAFSFELSNVARPYIRERVVDLLSRVDTELAKGVAANLGLTLTAEQLSRELPKPVNGITDDPALSLYRVNPGVLKSRRVSVLAADGVCGTCLDMCRKTLMDAGIHPVILAPRMGTIKTDDGREVAVNGRLNANPSLFVDAVVVPGGGSLKTLTADGDALYHLRQAYRHLKAIALLGEAEKLLKAAGLPHDGKDAGLVTGDEGKKVMKQFLEAMQQHRCWDREEKAKGIGA